MVIFRLAGQRLALPTAAVRECLPLPALWHRPGLPACVSGFFSLGGAVLPVIDLAVLLGLRVDAGADGLEQDGLYRPLLHVGTVALLVDRLHGVAAPDPTGGALPEPSTDTWQHGCVARHLFVSGQPVALLDPARILLADEHARLDVLVRDAARRQNGWATGDQATAVDPDAA